MTAGNKGKVFILFVPLFTPSLLTVLSKIVCSLCSQKAPAREHQHVVHRSTSNVKCAPACVLSVQKASNAYTQRGLCPLHVVVPATTPLECGVLKIFLRSSKYVIPDIHSKTYLLVNNRGWSTRRGLLILIRRLSFQDNIFIPDWRLQNNTGNPHKWQKPAQSS